MAEFVVYRHGKNPSNQMHSDREPVAAVEAESAQDAIKLASRVPYITILEGQHPSAAPRSESPIEDRDIAAAMEIVRYDSGALLILAEPIGLLSKDSNRMPEDTRG